MERVDEFSVEDGSYDFGARMYDARLGRWFALDALIYEYPSLSPYMFSLCGPIQFLDGDGRVIVDPKSGEQVVKVNGQWQTISGGKVSRMFTKYSQTELDLLTSSQIGTVIYEKLQLISTLVVFDSGDPENLAEHKRAPKNSVFKLENDDFTTGSNGLYLQKVTITLNTPLIESSAETDGVDYEEKFLQTLSVESDHLSDKEQIATESKYGHENLLATPEIASEVFTKLLHNAIRVGKKYREEKHITVDASSNLPIINFNRNNGTNIQPE